MKNLFEFLTNAIQKSEAAHIAGMSMGECENLAGELQEKIEPKATAVIEILEDIRDELESGHITITKGIWFNSDEYLRNATRKAIIILKELQ